MTSLLEYLDMSNFISSNFPSSSSSSYTSNKRQQDGNDIEGKDMLLLLLSSFNVIQLFQYGISQSNTSFLFNLFSHFHFFDLSMDSDIFEEGLLLMNQDDDEHQRNGNLRSELLLHHHNHQNGIHNDDEEFVQDMNEKLSSIHTLHSQLLLKYHILYPGFETQEKI